MFEKLKTDRANCAKKLKEAQIQLEEMEERFKAQL